MPVVINSVEALAEPPQPRGEPREADPAARPPGLTAQDVARLLRTEAERAARVRAH